MSRGVGRVGGRREINVETVAEGLDNEELGNIERKGEYFCPASSRVSSDAMRRHNHGPDAGKPCLPMTHQMPGMRERLVCGWEEDTGRAMGAASEVGAEPVQPMAGGGWWCGVWPHCEKSARMVGWAPAHAQANLERAEEGKTRRKRASAASHCARQAQSAQSVGKWRINQGKTAAQRIKEPATVAPVALSRKSCSWRLRLGCPSSWSGFRVAPCHLQDCPSRRQGGRRGRGPGGQGGISPSSCLSRVCALCAVCSEQAKSAEKNRDDTASGVYGLLGEQDG